MILLKLDLCEIRYCTKYKRRVSLLPAVESKILVSFWVNTWCHIRGRGDFTRNQNVFTDFPCIRDFPNFLWMWRRPQITADGRHCAHAPLLQPPVPCIGQYFFSTPYNLLSLSLAASSIKAQPWLRILINLFHNCKKLRPLTAGRIFGILAVTQKEKGTVYFLRRRC